MRSKYSGEMRHFDRRIDSKAPQGHYARQSSDAGRINTAQWFDESMSDPTLPSASDLGFVTSARSVPSLQGTFTTPTGQVDPYNSMSYYSTPSEERRHLCTPARISNIARRIFGNHSRSNESPVDSSSDRLNLKSRVGGETSYSTNRSPHKPLSTTPLSPAFEQEFPELMKFYLNDGMYNSNSSSVSSKTQAIANNIFRPIDPIEEIEDPPVPAKPVRKILVRIPSIQSCP